MEIPRNPRNPRTSFVVPDASLARSARSLRRASQAEGSDPRAWGLESQAPESPVGGLGTTEVLGTKDLGGLGTTKEVLGTRIPRDLL